MLTIIDCLNGLKYAKLAQTCSLANLEYLYRIGDIPNLMIEADESMFSAAKSFFFARALLLSIYDTYPSLSHKLDVDLTTNAAMQISVKRAEQFEFPVYVLSMPLLIPNKRRKNIPGHKDAITVSICAAAKKYCYENGVKPFDHATVIYASYHEGKAGAIDNDNKDTAVIQNGLISAGMLRDDHPDICHSIYYFKQVDDLNMTEIYVTDSAHDIEVYSWIKSK